MRSDRLLATRKDTRCAGAALLCASLAVTGCAGLFSRPAILTYEFELPSEETDVIGEVQATYARFEDTLADFARDYGLGFDEIVAANPEVDPWLPGEGTKVILPTRYVLPDAPREGIVINLASLRLFYYPKPDGEEPQRVITYPIGIGREGWRTPQGTFRITQKSENPVWTVPASVRREHAAMGDPLPAVVPAGPKNPLGEYAMRLNRPQYLLHGTNKPYGVGMRVSHGCIRLYPEDIARLYPEVRVGTRVRIVNQPYLAGWLRGRLYLEAHRPLAEEAKRWKGSLEPMERAVLRKLADRAEDVDWEKAAETAREARGIPVSVSAGGAWVEKVLAEPRWPLDSPVFAAREGQKEERRGP
jgi:L,D-transpeptidase ErfK/SrfK